MRVCDPIRRARLADALAPARVIVWPRVRSTQERALAMLEAGRLSPPALLVGVRQTAGRGRGSNRWWADAGSLCATLVLRVDASMPIGQVPLLAGLAVAETLGRLIPSRWIGVKWPNDVMVRGGKIAGILCARTRDADVIGIGLNVRADLRHAPPDVRAHAVSLRQFLRPVPARADLLVDVWRQVLAMREAPDGLMRYRARHILEDSAVRADVEGCAVHGRCRGVDAEGRLLLDVDGRRISITEATVRPSE